MITLTPGYAESRHQLAAAPLSSTQEREAWEQLLELLTPVLISEIGSEASLGARLNTALGSLLATVARLMHRNSQALPGPDRMRIITHGLPVPGNAATTFGECVHLSGDYDMSKQRFMLNHEYVHVLQYRALGLSLLPRYLFERLKARLQARDPYTTNPFEVQALRVESLLRRNPTLADVWNIPAGRQT